MAENAKKPHFSASGISGFPYFCRPFTSSSMVTAGMKRNNITGLVKKQS
jgi:hypothetical protein